MSKVTIDRDQYIRLLEIADLLLRLHNGNGDLVCNHEQILDAAVAKASEWQYHDDSRPLTV